MDFSKIAKEAMKNMARKSLNKVARLEAEIGQFQTKINIEKRRGNKKIAAIYESKLRLRKKALAQAVSDLRLAEGGLNVWQFNKK